MTGMAQTVLGQIPINQLGITLMREHLLLDLECYFDEPDTASEKKFIDAPLEFNLLGKYGARWSYNREGLHLHDIELAITRNEEWWKNKNITDKIRDIIYPLIIVLILINQYPNHPFFSILYNVFISLSIII